MKVRLAILVCFVGVGIGAAAGQNGPGKGAPLRLLLNEVQAGSMASEQYCALIFSDRRFHYERASRRGGKDRERKIYEGELSQADWDALAGILDSKDFRALNVPRTVPPAVIEDVHSFDISVARDNKFQNMEFLDNHSRKPYEAQLKPLLQWWKSFRKTHMTESAASADAKCSLDSSHGVFAR